MPFDPSKLQQLQSSVAAATTQRAQVARTIASKSASIAKIDVEIRRQTALGNAQAVKQHHATRQQIEASRTADIASLTAINKHLRDLIEQIGALTDTCDADPAVPLLLLPVRLETRFSANGKQLRVRVYPDDIHIDQLDRGVSEEERSAAVAYWTTAWRGADNDVNTAWRTFVKAVGSRRATWVATALTPSNLPRRKADAAPSFPATTPRTNEPAVATLLPDAFTVVAIQGTDRSERTGSPIAPAVTVGLYADDGTDLADVAGLKLHPETVWTVDYAEAERIGMAVTLDLKRPGARVDQLFVFGVRRGLDPRTAAPEALSDLLEAHRCTRGLAFIPQGTPTNNTESDRSAWQRGIEPLEPKRDIAPSGARSNASTLGAALGLPSASLDGLDHADEEEQSRAEAANIAMWSPSWGTFFEKVEHVSEGTSFLPSSLRERARALHRDAVRGRGPLPAIRVGNQPYGVLPVSSVDARWQPTAGDDFEADLLSLLKRLRAKWRQCVAGVPRVGHGDIDKAITEMLGTSAVSMALRVRPVLSYEIIDASIKIGALPESSLANEQALEELILRDWGLDADRMHGVGSLASKTRPLPLPLVHDSDAAFIDATLSGGSPAVKSVFQALLALSFQAATDDVNKDTASGHFGDVVKLATNLTQADRDRVLSVASRADAMKADALYAEATNIAKAGRGGAAPTLSELQPVAVTRSSFAELAMQSSSAAARAQLSHFAIHSWLLSLARLNELRAALLELKSTSLEERRILIAEALDLASHRLDAWITALVERRRQALRQSSPVGITIGAYGWVEELQPTGQRQMDGGFVHAPSLAHAATAGILRSAYLSHNGTAAGSGAFAIDLTSARVRAALELLDGVRQGQPLSALLGYRIERRIHEAQLDRLILSLRAIAPLTQGKLTDRNAPPDQASLEAIAAANVIDGVELVEKFQGKINGWSAARVHTTLDTKPTNNPYLTGAWPALTAGEWAAVSEIIESAASACDAVSDVLLAESVHQLVNGNVARASAALDAASGGDAPAPQPDVVVTPGDAMPFTHTVMLIAAGGAPWSAERPRASAEPRLEAWAAARLGDAAKIVVSGAPGAAPITVADSKLCALDLIYNAGDRALFMQRLRVALEANLPEPRRAALREEGQFHDVPAAGWAQEWRAIGDVFELAASLRTVLVNARPLSAMDLSAANAPTTRAAQPAALADARSRATKAAGLLDTRAASLAATLDALAPDPDAAHLAALSAKVDLLADFGIAIPQVTGDNLVSIARLLLSEARRRVAAAQSALADAPTVERVITAGNAVFGDGFWILTPLAAPEQPDGWTAALASTPAGATPTSTRVYLTDLAAVRDNVRRYLEALLLCEATGRPPALRVGQIIGAGGSAPSRWIGGALDPAEPTPTAPITSAVMDIAGSYAAENDTVGLVIDHWVDVVPVRERRGAPDDAAARVDERVTSAVAFNAAAPSARAPQALLLAVSPDGKRWTRDAVLDTLQDTLDLAKIRAVTLERTNGVARILPALYEKSWSLQGEKVLDIRYIAEKSLAMDAIAAFVKE